MNKRIKYIVLSIIACLIFALSISFGLIEAQQNVIRPTISVTDENNELHSGYLMGFMLPGYSVPLEDRIFVFDKNWKGAHIFFRWNPRIILESGSSQRNPSTGISHKIATIRANNREDIYFINRDANILIRDFRGNDFGIPIRNIKEMAIINR